MLELLTKVSKRISIRRTDGEATVESQNKLGPNTK